MATLSGEPHIFPFGTTEESTTVDIALGTRAKDTTGNEYVFLRGTASTVAGNWVLYDPVDYTTKLVDTDDVGPLAIAGTATTLLDYGWYQIYGKNTIAGNSGAVAADVALYLTANSGYVDDADAAGEFIVGACSLAASSGSAFTVWLAYPMSYNAAID